MKKESLCKTCKNYSKVIIESNDKQSVTIDYIHCAHFDSLFKLNIFRLKREYKENNDVEGYPNIYHCTHHEPRPKTK